MKISDTETKDALLRRLRRVEGQLRGLQDMVTEERDCVEILQQLSAARSALQGASLQLIENAAAGCLAQASAEGDAARQEQLKELVRLLSKTP